MSFTTHLTYALYTVLAFASVEIDCQSYCDGIFPKTLEPEQQVQERIVISNVQTYQDAPARESNAHDDWNGCLDLQVGEFPKYHRDCMSPMQNAQVTIQVYIPAYPNFPSRNGIFTCVRVLDRLEDGTGAEAFITAGGAGFDYVNYTLIGQEHQGIKHFVELYWRGGGGRLTGPGWLAVFVGVIVAVLLSV